MLGCFPVIIVRCLRQNILYMGTPIVKVIQSLSDYVFACSCLRSIFEGNGALQSQYTLDEI